MDQTTTVVNPEVTAGNSEVGQTQGQENVTPGVVTPTPAPQPGEKTDSSLLLKALQEEREKRRLLEEEARILREQALSTPTLSEEEMSDEGKALKQEIAELKAAQAKLEEQRELEGVYAQHPELKEFAGEFETYKQDYPRHKLANVAKIFLTEKGLLEPRRPGLESPTGGPKTAPTSGTMSAEDVANLRKTDFKKYQQMVMNGQIKIA